MLDTLVRQKNIKFFLLVTKRSTIRVAAREAGLCVQHGVRLLKKWRECNWLSRTGLYGSKYEYTDVGRAIAEAMVRVESDLSLV